MQKIGAIPKSPNRYQRHSIISFAICVSIRYGIIDYPLQLYISKFRITTMSIQFEMDKQIIEETCPNRKIKFENIRLFAGIIKSKKYQKGEIILNEGDICNCLFYIEKGLTRQFYVKHDKEVTEHLANEKEVVWCIESYFNRKPTHLMLEALEQCVVWEIPRDIMEELSDSNGDFAYLYRRFLENSLILSQLKADYYVLSRQKKDIADCHSIFRKL